MIGPLAIAGIAAGVGAIAGGTLQSISGKRRATRHRRERRRQDALENLFSQNLFGDPQLQQLLGSSKAATGQQLINPRKIFQDASQQVESVVGRRQQDSQRTLASFGLDANSAQGRFVDRRFNRARVQQLGSLRQLIDTSAIEVNKQAHLEAVAADASLVSRFEALAVGNQ